MARTFAILLVVSMLVACGDTRPAPAPAPATPAALPEESVPEASGRVAITVDGMGFHPSTIHARIGQPLKLVFTRVSEAGCAQELVVASLGVRKPLPLNQPVELDVTPTSELRFACGMDMLRGQVVVHGTSTN
jgi:plastocyanin domain-containing protein